MRLVARLVRLGRGRNPFRAAFVREIVRTVESQTTFPLLTRLDREQREAFQRWMADEGVADPGDGARRLIHDELVRMGFMANRPHAPRT